MGALSSIGGSLMSGMGMSAAMGTGTGLGAALTAMGPVGWGIMGVGALTAGLSAGAKQKEARQRYNLLGDQIGDVKQGQQKLGENYRSQLDLFQEQFAEDTQQLATSTAFNLEDVYAESTGVMQKQGGLKSGAAGQLFEEATEKIDFEKDSRLRGLKNTLYEREGSALDFKESEGGRLSSELSRLNFERKKASSDMSSWGMDFLFG